MPVLEKLIQNFLQLKKKKKGGWSPCYPPKALKGWLPIYLQVAISLDSTIFTDTNCKNRKRKLPNTLSSA